MSETCLAGTRAGSRRFWITVFCFALANLAVWVVYHQVYGARGKDLLRVDRFSPGDGAVITGKADLTWRFNLDVRPETADGLPPATLEPRVPGRFQWRDGRTLMFFPAQDLPRATPIKLTIPAGRLHTADGFRLSKPFVTMVRSTPLAVVGVRQAGFEEAGRYVIELEFSDRVIPADVLAKLKLIGPDGGPLGFKPHGDAVGNLVRILTDSVAIPARHSREALAVQVRLEKGLAGASGPLGLEEPFEQKVEVGQTLAATSADGACPAKGQPRIHLRFNGDIELPALREVLSIEPSVPLTFSSDYRGVALHGELTPGTRYALKIAAAPKGADPAKYPCPDTLSVFIPDRESGAWFEHEEGYLGANGNRTLLAHAVNLPEMMVKVWRIYDNNLVEWRNSQQHAWTPTERAYGRPMASRRLALRNEKNKVQDIRLALDELLPADAAADGVYRVSLEPAEPRAGRREEADEESDFGGVAYASAVATLSDIGLTAKRSGDGILAWAVSLSSARPMQRVRIRVYSNKNQLLGEGLTGPDGLAWVATIPPAQGERPSVVLADVQSASPRARAATQPSTQPVARLAAAGKRPVAPSSALTWLNLRNTEWNLADVDIAGRPYLRTGYEAFVYADRGVYRPGETAHLRAIVRQPGWKTPAAFPVKWQIRRPDLRDWRSQVKVLEADGTVGLDLPLPADLTTGRWTAEIGLPGESAGGFQAFGTVAFLVEEFIPNRLKVAVRLETGDPPGPSEDRRFPAGGKPLSAVVQGDYLFGRPAAHLNAAFTARLDPATFAPRQWSGWTFGDSARLIELPGTSRMGAIAAAGGAGLCLTDSTLDEKGQARWELDLKEMLRHGAHPAAAETDDDAEPPAEQEVEGQTRRTLPPATADYSGPWRLSVAASVQETGGRAVTAGDGVDVDLLPWYIGVRQATPEQRRPNAPLSFRVKLIRPQGQAAGVDASLQATLLRESWNSSLIYRDGQYHYRSHRVLDPVPGKDTVLAIRAGEGTVELVAPESGAYILRLRNAATGALTSLGFYVSDGNPWEDSISRENPERLELVVLPHGSTTRPSTQPVPPDKTHRFRPGEKATVLVRSPFAGRLLLTVETDRVVSRRVMEMKASQVEVPIEITEACRPNLYITATVIRPIDPNAKWRTHRALGATRIGVEASDHNLTIDVQAPAEIRPRSTLDVRLRVADSRGRAAANAVLTVAAVDEGVLQLTGFATPDPLGFFHGTRALGVESFDLYGALMPEVPRPGRASPVGGDEARPSRYRSPVTNRRFVPVALFSGPIRTDAQGYAQASFTVPEFSGQLRIMAVGSSGGNFGCADKPTLVRSPLLVQSSFPRFVAPGDQFDASIALFNNSTKDGEVSLKLELLPGEGGPSPLAFASAGPELSLPPIAVRAAQQGAARVSLSVGQRIGVARIRLTASMNGESCEENIELPVRPANPAITRGGYAAAGVASPLKLVIPGELLAGTERLTIKVTPWPTLQLPEGLDYLDRYPHGCAEQTVSTCFPLVYLNDLGAKIAPGMFEKARVDAKVQAGILRLIGMQAADGGISMWPGDRESWPWASVYAAHFLVEAESAGHPVPEDFRKRLLAHVRRLLDRGGDDGQLLEVQAYACYVLAIAGKPERVIMNRLSELANARDTAALAEFAPQRAQARLYLAMAFLASGRRDLAASSIPQALPLPRDQRQSGGNVGSPIRDRAMLVNTLLMVQPDHPALPSLVQQLADAGRGGQWRSTQDCAFAVMAIGRYLRQVQAQHPYESAQLLRGPDTLATSRPDKTLSWSEKATLPAEAAQRGDREFLIRLSGAADARGQASWLQSGVPLGSLPAADNGLKVRRQYLDIAGNPLSGDSIPSGDLVRVELTVDGPPGLENVVIEDLLPAGLEIENPRLQTTAAAAIAPLFAGKKSSALQAAEAHVDMRDDRLVLVTSLSGSGHAAHSYLARAVSPGIFVIPPVRAECMYDVATRSLSGGGGKLTVRRLDAKQVATN